MNERVDPRIKEYLYWNQLKDHLKGDTSKIFSDEFVWPKQWEIHLPSDHVKSCQLNCVYCAGLYFEKPLGTWELDCLSLMDKVAGNIPQHVYGGSYTEPLTNPYFMTFMAKTKQYGNNFGIHTNGVALLELDNTQKFLTELNRLSTDDVDYLSVSLDAGTAWTWGKTKRVKNTGRFWDIIEALKRARDVKDKNGGKGHSLRLGYLITEHTDSQEEFEIIVNLAKNIGLDSVRFSIPFAHYNQTFDEVREYKNDIELKHENEYEKKLAHLVSKSKDEKPYIFWNYPYFTDIDRFEFDRCAYGYFQITNGADGYWYRCSTVSTPTAKHLRLGKSTADLDEFKNAIAINQKASFNCKKECFDKKLRCNRMGLEINTAVAEL